MREQVIVTHDPHFAQRAHEPLIDPRYQRHIMKSLRSRPAAVLIAAPSTFRPSDRRERGFGRLDHANIVREFMLNVGVRHWLNGDDISGAVVNFQPCDRLPHGPAVKPAIEAELPENFRMGLIDPARELRIAHNVSAVAFNKKIGRTHDLTIARIQLRGDAEQRLIDHRYLPTNGL